MKIKQILLALVAVAVTMPLVGCTGDFSKVEQGRVIVFDKEKKEITLIHDSAMDPQNPVYDVLPPSVFKLPTDPAETGPPPQAGQRMKLDMEKSEMVIFDTTTQTLVHIPITITDKQSPIDKEHALVYDKVTKKEREFPAIDQDKKTITIYSGRQKTLCTFTVPEQYFSYPASTWTAGDEVRLTYKADNPSQSLRFMNISKTNIFKR